MCDFLGSEERGQAAVLASLSSLALGAAISEVWVLRVPREKPHRVRETERNRETGTQIETKTGIQRDRNRERACPKDVQGPLQPRPWARRPAA